MDGNVNTGYRELLHVVADPSRWKILSLLSARPCTVGELVDQLDVAQPSVSHHLGRLREAGLVVAVVEGRARRYCWSDQPGGQVHAEVLQSLRGWIRGGDALDGPGRLRPVRPRPIEVHLL